jgi:hypothetical protein
MTPILASTAFAMVHNNLMISAMHPGGAELYLSLLGGQMGKIVLLDKNRGRPCGTVIGEVRQKRSRVR